MFAEAQFIRRAAAVPNQIGRIKFGSSTTYESIFLIKFDSAVCSTDSADSSIVAALIHTSNLILAEPNTFKEVVINFNMLTSVFGEIPDSR